MDADDDFVAFVSGRWTALYRLAYLLAASGPNGEDLLQTSLEKTYMNWSRVRQMESPEAYVRKVMVNALISHRRRPAWRREVLRDQPPERQVDSPEQEAVEHTWLWPLVCALPERQRAVIVLRYYEDLAESEIAEALGCAVGTVKSQASDAMKRLRRDVPAGVRGHEVGTES